jgi:hypothetical protein
MTTQDLYYCTCPQWGNALSNTVCSNCPHCGEEIKAVSESSYLGYSKIRNSDGSVSVYHNGRNVSNEILPSGVDIKKFNAITVIELSN